MYLRNVQIKLVDDEAYLTTTVIVRHLFILDGRYLLERGE